MQLLQVNNVTQNNKSNSLAQSNQPLPARYHGTATPYGSSSRSQRRINSLALSGLLSARRFIFSWSLRAGGRIESPLSSCCPDDCLGAPFFLVLCVPNSKRKRGRTSKKTTAATAANQNKGTERLTNKSAHPLICSTSKHIPQRLRREDLFPIEDIYSSTIGHIENTISTQKPKAGKGVETECSCTYIQKAIAVRPGNIVSQRRFSRRPKKEIKMH